MSKHIRIAAVTLLLTGSASPALAAVPRLTGDSTDYVLMPLLGYLSLVVGSWGLTLLTRLTGDRA